MQQDGSQRRRTRTVWIIAIAVAFFFFVDPFRLFEGDKIPTTRVDRETAAEMTAFAFSADTPADTIVGLLASSDVVLIGETGYVSEHVNLMADMIPRLYSSGVGILFYQFANTEDQNLIDELITGSSFNEQTAQTILFNHLTVFGFQEHVSLFRAAWEVNRQKPDDSEPFRILAMSGRLDYTAIVSQEDVEDPEVMQRVFVSGIPDEVMAETIAREALDKQIKAVAYMQIDHAFTGYQQTAYVDQLAELGFDGVRRAGNTLRRQYGDRVVTAVLHGPVGYSRSRVGFGYPTADIVEEAVSGISSPIGFVIADSPFSDVPIIADSVGDNGLDRMTLAEYAEAYLVAVPISQLTAVTPIPDFINSDNLDKAIESFPGVRPEDATVDDMNAFIAGNAERMNEAFSEFD